MILDFNKKIKNRLDDYLEFDSDLLFNLTDYCEIFGGAIRDSLAETEIYDVDILCLSKSANQIVSILEKNGYKILNNLFDKDIYEMYKDIRVIFQPITFINSNQKIVQIIRPRPKGHPKDKVQKINLLSESFFKIMREVDISSCGVSYNGKLRENVKYATLHSLCKVFEKVENSKMYHTDRYEERSRKLIDRGWRNKEDIDIEKDEKYNYWKLIFDRERKINKIRNE